MSESTAEPRAATTDDVPRVASTISAAFIGDPVMRFAFPGAHEYLAAVPDFVSIFTRGAAAHGGALVATDFSGAALWMPPGEQVDGEALGRYLADHAHRPHLDDLFGTFAEMAEYRPDAPHWYLSLIGVDPHARGRGIGAQLLQHATARCDAAGEVAFLESSNPRNVSLYERHGFEPVGRIQVGAGPLVTPMRRDPR